MSFKVIATIELTINEIEEGRLWDDLNRPPEPLFEEMDIVKIGVYQALWHAERTNRDIKDFAVLDIKYKEQEK